MNKIIVKCDYCRSEYQKQKKDVNYNKKHNYSNFCSKLCLSASRKTAVDTNCSRCGKKTAKTHSTIQRSKSGNLYCSKSCAVSSNNTLYKTGETHPNFTTGRASYRKRALKHYGSKCALCDYCIKGVLQVHHKDKNRSNNHIDNLIVLCPTHHKEVHVLVEKVKL